MMFDVVLKPEWETVYSGMKRLTDLRVNSSQSYRSLNSYCCNDSIHMITDTGFP